MTLAVSIAWSKSYWQAIKFSIGVQILSLLYFSLLLIEHLVLDSACIACAAFWIAIAIIVCRRPEAPTRGDIAFIRGGFMPLVAIAVFAAMTLPRVADLQW